jgi:hypothetical protein
MFRESRTFNATTTADNTSIPTQKEPTAGKPASNDIVHPSDAPPNLADMIANGEQPCRGSSGTTSQLDKQRWSNEARDSPHAANPKGQSHYRLLRSQVNEPQGAISPLTKGKMVSNIQRPLCSATEVSNYPARATNSDSNIILLSWPNK